MKRNYTEKFIMVVSLVIFCVITIINLLNHNPWSDEAHAWMLAKQMTFSNFISILHQEGHFVIWYLFLLPFAKLNLCYPYSMLFINWIAYFTAICIMWKKAPFSPVMKAVITLSWCSLYYLPVVARCYSIGVLGLFLLASFYNDKIKHPVLYSALLVLTAHTSLIATFAVIPLGLIFLYEMKNNFCNANKRQFIISCLILIIGATLWLMPFVSGYGSESLLNFNYPSLKLLGVAFKAYHYILGLSFFICFLMLFYFADKKIKFFILLPAISFLLFFNFIYHLYFHHIVLIYAFLVTILWLTPKLHKRDVASYVFLIVFAILSNLSLSPFVGYILNNPNKEILVNYINSEEINCILVTHWLQQDFKPLLKKPVKFLYLNNFDENDIYLKYCKNKNKTIAITEFPLNEESIVFEWPKKSFPERIFVTKF